MENLTQRIASTLSNESLAPEQDAQAGLHNQEIENAESLVLENAERSERREIRGKRYRACKRNGKIFLVWRKRGDLPNSIGFELDFDQSTTGRPPVYLQSRSQVERFIDGET